MEKETKQNCGCGTDCCQPKKSKPWVKIIFGLIVLAALAIVAIKLINNNCSERPVGTSIATQKSECGSAQSKPCCADSTQSCCAKKKK